MHHSYIFRSDQRTTRDYTRGEEKGASWPDLRTSRQSSINSCAPNRSHPREPRQMPREFGVTRHSGIPAISHAECNLHRALFPVDHLFPTPLHHTRDFRWSRRQDFHVATIRHRSTDVSRVKVIVSIDGTREREIILERSLWSRRRHSHAMTLSIFFNRFFASSKNNISRQFNSIVLFERII